MKEKARQVQPQRNTAISNFRFGKFVSDTCIIIIQNKQINPTNYISFYKITAKFIKSKSIEKKEKKNNQKLIKNCNNKKRRQECNCILTVSSSCWKKKKTVFNHRTASHPARLGNIFFISLRLPHYQRTASHHKGLVKILYSKNLVLQRRTQSTCVFFWFFPSKDVFSPSKLLVLYAVYLCDDSKKFLSSKNPLT